MINQNRATIAAVALALLAASCAGVEKKQMGPFENARFTVRPHRNGTPAASRPNTPAWLYVPASMKAPAPLIISLHGAGGRGAPVIEYLREDADRIGAIVIAPDSVGRTWDVIDEIGPDVERIDAQLDFVFEHFAIDPERIAISGFSDGASYALTLGVANGDLFTHVIAHSPGFLAPPVQNGAPRIYVSHGTGDEILPIDRCSRRLVPSLKSAGYDVTYREFDGGHTVPEKIQTEAFDWFTE